MTLVLLYSPDPQRLAALGRSLSVDNLHLAGGTDLGTLLPRPLPQVLIVADAGPGDPAGATFYRQWMSVPRVAPVPILLIVNAADESGLGMLFGCGVVDILEQPLTTTALRERVQWASQHKPPAPSELPVRALHNLRSFLERSRRSGIICVETPAGTAKLHVAAGQVPEGECAGSRGVHIVHHVMSLTEVGQIWFEAVAPVVTGSVRAEDVQSTPAPVLGTQVSTPMPIAAGIPVAQATPAVVATTPHTTPVPKASTPASTPMPVAAAGVRASGSVARRVVEATGPKREAPVRKALAVDDDLALLEIACRFLQRAGFEVSRANEGRTAMELAVVERPDVIVSDIMMPDVDGWAFLRMVRDDHRLAEVPFLLLSCHDEYRDKLRQVGAGADGYLAKGIRGEQLTGAVMQALAPHREVWDLVEPGMRIEGRVEVAGGQNLTRALGYFGCSGTLRVKDAWIEVALGFLDGMLVSATASTDVLTFTDNEALRSFVTIRRGTFVFDPLEMPTPALALDVDQALDDACLSANQADDEVRDRLLLAGSGVILQPDLLTLYERVCAHVSPNVIEALRRGMNAGETMVATGESPLLVEWVIKDMVRKGVAVFKTTADL